MVAFFAAVLLALVVILAVDPGIYTAVAPVPPIAFLLPIATLIVLLCVGVVKRWRWTFWLILLAFAAGVLRVPASILELAGVVKATSPAWYVVLQGVIGVVQVIIAVQMYLGFRRGGYWADP